MSQTDLFTGHGYEVVAWARGQRTLYYVTFGDYTGEWLLLSRDDQDYFLYKGYYGSCSGCDAFEATFNYGEVTREKAVAFAKDYLPFIEIPLATMRGLVQAGTLAQVFPANIRDGFWEINYDEAVSDMTLVGKLEEGLPIVIGDILAAKNQEVKQRALRVFGYEKFVDEAGAETIHRDGDDELVKIDDVVFLSLKDSSTERRYLLRVPPQMLRVRQAKAWTFQLDEHQYVPVVET